MTEPHYETLELRVPETEPIRVAPSRRWLYLAVLFTALLIVVIAQLASAPSGATQQGVVPLAMAASSGSESLRGAPMDVSALGRPPAPVGAPLAATGLRGYASWYDVASGHAAAGPLLRTGDWRGRAVTVCAGSDCIVTRLTDWCACGSRHGIPTLIDLARSDFARLAPPSSGIVLVTVRGATLPPTDVAP
jgi:hypothetical protein